ncbi:gliding motility-associated C-terminal domain-containing protein, partial [Flavobacterium sp. WG47]|nr:gliding motility-associated C-terminal domain-containing protein [Flavobacterium sp. WG47]
ITVTDNIAPTFTAPANIEIFTTADCTYDASIAITGDVTNEADNCSTGLQATFADSVADGQCAGSHIITRTWSLVDACGNAAATQTQTITVTDNIAPTFTAPANIEIFTTADCTYDATVAVTGDVTNEAD